ncbi:LysR family transcriptional regulator [Vibrio lentus]|nr:LysR family transcriptional regulator [Vibrio lentus]
MLPPSTRPCCVRSCCSSRFHWRYRCSKLCPQAAVSQQLKSLEAFLDTTLFERSSKGVKLTSSAQHYQPIVAGSLAHLKLQTQICSGKRNRRVESAHAPHLLS